MFRAIIKALLAGRAIKKLSWKLKSYSDNDQLTHEGQSRKALPFCAFYENTILILYNYSKFKSKMQAPVLNNIKIAKGINSLRQIFF